LYTAVQGVRSLFEAGASEQSYRASLETVTGSVEAAGAAFEQVEKFAATTPFPLEESLRAFIKLKALGLDPSEEALRSYGNTSLAMGKKLNDMIEAVADATTGEFERLKEFGIKANSQGDSVAFTFRGITTVVRKNAQEIEAYLRGIGDTDF
jgi:phage-related minor tail protein